MISTIKAFVDLTRLHFGPVWPLLFCSGAMLGFAVRGEFSWLTLFHVALIGFLGGTGGIVLNDYVDREYDKRDIDTGGLTRYWRPFGSRPVAGGQIRPVTALVIFIVLAISTLVLILLLPFPRSIYVAASLCCCYVMEWFYQIKKRNQRFPFSQLLGRTDFALFPAAGYMAVAGPAPLAFIYMAVFYPLTQVHLGVNDLADVRNDEARGMKSIPLLYGCRGTAWWIGLFAVSHLGVSWLLLRYPQPWAAYAMFVPFGVVAAASILIFLDPTPRRGLRVLPMIHVTIALEAGILIASGALRLGS